MSRTLSTPLSPALSPFLYCERGLPPPPSPGLCLEGGPPKRHHYCPQHCHCSYAVKGACSPPPPHLGSALEEVQPSMQARASRQTLASGSYSSWKRNAENRPRKSARSAHTQPMPQSALRHCVTVSCVTVSACEALIIKAKNKSLKSTRSASTQSRRVHCVTVSPFWSVCTSQCHCVAISPCHCASVQLLLCSVSRCLYSVVMCRT